MAPQSLPIPALRITWSGPCSSDRLLAAMLDRVLVAELGERLPEATLGPSVSADGAHEITVAEHGDIEPAAVAALLARHTPAAVLSQRVAYLRATAVLPRSADVPITATDHRSPPDRAGLRAATTDASVPVPVSPVDDAAAVLSTAAVLITEDPVLAAAAAGFGTPALASSRADRFDPAVAVVRPPDPTDIDRRLDRVAADTVARAAAGAGITAAELQARRVAHFAREHHHLRVSNEAALNRAATSRQRLTEALQDALAGQDVLRAELEVTQGTLRAETERREHVESELEAVYATRTFRATAGLRSLYARVRGRRAEQ